MRTPRRTRERQGSPPETPHTHGRSDCCIVGCERPCVHGVCEHHRRMYHLYHGAHGHWPEKRTPEVCLAFLRARCRLRPDGDPDPCWDPDTRAINDKGYVWVTFGGCRKVRGHRLAWRLQHVIDGGAWGDLGPRDYVLHAEQCERRYIEGQISNRCWNPAHMRLGDSETNLREAWERRIKYDPWRRRECVWPGCGGEAVGNMLCHMHFKRIYGGRLQREAALDEAPVQCSTPGCEHETLRHGQCKRCYERGKARHYRRMRQIAANDETIRAGSGT